MPESPLAFNRVLMSTKVLRTIGLPSIQQPPFRLIQRTASVFVIYVPRLAVRARIKYCLDCFALLIEFSPLRITEKNLSNEFLPIRRTRYADSRFVLHVASEKEGFGLSFTSPSARGKGP